MEELIGKVCPKHLNWCDEVCPLELHFSLSRISL